MKDLYGVLGHPVSHSMSPKIFNAAFKKANIKAEYDFFDVEPENLETFIEELSKNNIKGLSVTIPHKVSVMKFLDNISEKAAKIGAVNTVINDGGILKGENFDVDGAMEALEEKTKIKKRKIVVLGAGGAARAIINGLSENKCEVLILSRNEDLEEATKLAEEYNSKIDILDKFHQYSEETEILINATPVGMSPKIKETPINTKSLHKDTLVFDIVYNPQCTQLLKDAMEVGCDIQTGDKMFIHQAAKQFEFWTGEKAPLKVMEKILKKELK